MQLTDGIKGLLDHEKVYGYTFEGKRHDAGDKFGMLKATVEFALKRNDLGPGLREYLKQKNCSDGHRYSKEWWARRDSNPQPRDYESPALTVELQALQ